VESDPYLCPTCGWTGNLTELNQSVGGYTCPVCEADIAVEA
jgi:DNA-directed RNA polymerase subunit RPC12/RpoP